MKSALIIGLLAFLTWTQFAHGREVSRLETALDTLASNEIVRRAADSLEWETKVATVTQNMGESIRDHAEKNDSLSARVVMLVDVVEGLEGRVATATEINVNLAAALRTDSASATVFATAGEAPDSVTAPYDDGLLSGTISFFPPTTTFGLEYQAQIRGSLVTAELPDGRWSVFAAAEDSARVQLSFGEVFVNVAPPVQVCTFVQKGKWAGIGAAALALWRSR